MAIALTLQELGVTDRTIWLYDTFEGMTSPTSEDVDFLGRRSDEETPEVLALLRLDTDFYVSTRDEMQALYPRLSMGGVCVVDDYGHFDGARKAIDEYFADHPPRPLINRIDYTGRVFVKTS